MESILVNNSYMDSSIRDDFNFYDPLFTKNIELIKSSSYQIVVFGEMIEDLCNGTTPLGGKFEEEGVYFFRSQNFNSEGLDFEDMKYTTKEFHNQLKRSALKPDDILIAVVGATLGVVSIVPKDFTEGNINQNVCKITLKKEPNILPYYVMAFLDSKFGNSQLLKESTITAKGYINNDKIKRLLILLPPLNIQKKISELMQLAYFLRKQKLKQVEEESTKINDYVLKKLGINLSNIKDEKRFLIYNLNLTERDNVEYYQSKTVETISSIINGKYKTKKLGVLIKSLNTGLTPPSNEDFSDKGIFFLRTTNIDENEFNYENMRYISGESYNTYKNLQVESGNILLTIAGTIGHAITIPKNFGKALFNQNIMRIIVNNELEPEYLSAFLNTIPARTQLEQESTLAIIKYANSIKVKSLDIPVPDKEKQKEIINGVNAIKLKINNRGNEANLIIERSRHLRDKMIIGEVLTKQEEQFYDDLIKEANKLGFTG